METQFEQSAPEIRPFYVGVDAKKKNLSGGGPKSVETVIAPDSKNKYPVEHVKQTKRTRKLMNSIDSYFSKPEHMGKLMPFIQAHDPKDKPLISIRLIEWFVCNYCMENKVEWYLPGNTFFNVYLDYQEMMDDYRKQLFDPNARKWRKEKRKEARTEKEHTVRVYHGLRFYYTDTEYVITTIAQLNFFRWFIEKGVFDYMNEHYDVLSAAKNEFNKSKKAEKKRIAAGGEAAPPNTAAAAKKPKQRVKQTTRASRRRGGASDVGSWNGIPVREAKRKIRVQATKRVTKQNVEVYVSFD